MIPIRNAKPCRRLNPTQTPINNDWTKHKKDLKEDFNSHCGYCYSFDGFRLTYFEVDHFVPKSLILKNGNISLIHYPNLVYSCKFCNNNKLSKWPTQSETIHNDGKHGFVDPCSDEYDDHFYRSSNGAIMWKTELGKWMYTEAFKFDERERSIVILWNLNRLREIMDSIVVIMNKLDNSSLEYISIKEKLGSYAIEYVSFHKELMEFHDR